MSNSQSVFNFCHVNYQTSDKMMSSKRYAILLKHKFCNSYIMCNIDYLIFSELKKLSEESLTRQPEEVFDIICKLGEG